MAQMKLSNIPSYQDILELSFNDFLRKKEVSEKTRRNYRSDIRHFIGWAQLTIESTYQRIPKTHIEFLNELSPAFVSRYKTYLLTSRIPPATINRRLSTVRNFFRFCTSQAWITKNPVEKLTGVRPSILSAFEQDLAHQGASRITIKTYVTDVREFLEWLNQKEY